MTFFIVKHAAGNLHVFQGPDDFNEDMGLEVVFWLDEWSIEFGLHGLASLTFMTVHLLQVRFADTDQCFLDPALTFIHRRPIWWITLTFLWLNEKNVPLFRDTFPNEYKVLKNPEWRRFSVMAVVIFMTSACLGSGKLTLAKLLQWFVCGVFHNLSSSLSAGTARHTPRELELSGWVSSGQWWNGGTPHRRCNWARLLLLMQLTQGCFG